MELKIKIKHQTGSKSGQIEEFAPNAGDVKMGRGNRCLIQYDPDIDDMVSREHAAISVDSQDAETFWIEDFNSSNGLFVNGKQVRGKTKIYAGDVVQLGAKGPTFIFDLDPRPESHIKKTQVVDVPPVKATTVHKTGVPAGQTPPQPQTEKHGVGKETVQRMVLQERKKAKTNTLFIAAGILLLVVAGGIGIMRMIKGIPEPDPVLPIDYKLIKDEINKGAPKTPTQIAEENSDKVIFIEFAWKLIHAPTGDDLGHLLMKVNVNGEERLLGAFTRTSQGIEPCLVTRSSNIGGGFRQIGSMGTGSGFVVAPDGFILTNRHVVASWLAPYDFPGDIFPGVLLDDNGKIIPNALITKEMVSSWVPAAAYNINNDNAFKVVEGVNLYVDVTFARNDLRIPAKVSRISNKHDVAMIKIDIPSVLPIVELYDNYNTIKTGNDVTVMGYPGLSPSQFTAVQSQDYFNRNPQLVRVPVPTLSQGNIGRLIKGSTQTATGEYYSVMGDSYQLTINSTGPGNSGGPLFDDYGRVIGIYNSGNQMMTFAVPIKYGLELMGIDPVIESR